MDKSSGELGLYHRAGISGMSTMEFMCGYQEPYELQVEKNMPQMHREVRRVGKLQASCPR
jgi:hypothetical protein